MDILGFIWFFAVQFLVAHLISNKFRKIDFLSSITLVISCFYLIVNILFLVKLPLGGAFLVLMLLESFYCILSYKIILSFEMFKNRNKLLTIALFTLTPCLVIYFNGLHAWNEFVYALVAKNIWANIPEVAAEAGKYLMHSFLWASTSSLSDTFANSAGGMFNFLILSITLYALVKNRYLYFLALPIIFLMFSEHYFTTGHHDALKSVATVIVFFACYKFFFENSHFINLLGPFLFLSFARNDGFALAGIISIAIVLIVFTMKILKQDAPKFSKIFILGAILLFAVMVRVVIVKLFQLSYDTPQMFKGTFVIPPWTFLTFKNILLQFFKIRYMAYPIVLLLCLTLLMPDRKRVTNLFFYLLILCGKTLFVIIAYLFILPESDGANATFFDRYISHINLIPWILIFNFIPENYFEKRRFYSFAVHLVAYIVLVFYSINLTNVKNLFSGELSAQKIVPLCNIDSSDKLQEILFVDQKGNGYIRGLVRVDAMPHDLHYFKYNSDKSTFNQFDPSENIDSSEKWLNFIRKYEVSYIIINSDDSYFKKTLWPQDKVYPKSLPACIDIRAWK